MTTVDTEPGSPPTGPTRTASRRRPGLALLTATLVTFAWVESALLIEQGGWSSWPLLVLPGVAVVFAIAGQAASVRRPDNRMGALIMFGSLALIVSGTASFSSPAASALGVIAATTPLAVVVHLLHAFPSGHCRTGVSRLIVVVGYVVSTVLQAPQYLLDPSGSVRGSLAVVDGPGLAAAVHVAQIAVGGAVMVATVIVLVARWWRATPARARVLAPLYAYGSAAVLAIPVVPNVLAPALRLDDAYMQLIQGLVLAVVPVAFTAALLTGGFPRVGELRELSVRLAADDPGLLVSAVADTLGDPSVRLAFRRTDTADFVGADGHPVTLPAPGSHRAAATVGVDGRTVGAIVYDAAAADDSRTVRAVADIIGLAMDRQRLEVELRAEQRVVRESRARLMVAADRERERVARDLHDGLQAQLVLLSVQAQQLARLSDMPADAAAEAVRLRVRIDEAAARLRGLVFTVMPPLLVERGLVAAVEDLADRMPVPTAVTADLDGPVNEPARSTAYFVVAELLSNTVKHAHADRAGVRLVRRDGMLVVAVDDDGVGGADGGGHGMRGIADRIGALGGTVRVDSAAGEGTTVRMELPCGS